MYPHKKNTFDRAEDAFLAHKFEEAKVLYTTLLIEGYDLMRKYCSSSEE